jgi:hypothetical protein
MQVAPDVELARCFLRLCNLPNYALDRLGRYEATLWRQAGQFDGFDRPDETPKTFAELKPPGYWSKTLGRFVEVRKRE